MGDPAATTVPSTPPPEPAWKEFAAAPLVPVALAAAMGLIVDRYGQAPLGAELLAAAGGLLAWAVGRRRTPDRAVVWLWLAAGGLAAAHHQTHRTAFAADDIATFTTAQPTPARVRGTLDDEPSRFRPPRPDPLLGRPESQTAATVLALTAVETRDGWRPTSGRARLSLEGKLDGLHLGDSVEVVALLSLPNGPSNPGEADTATMLHDRRITAVLRAGGSAEPVTRLEEGWRGSFFGWVAALRGWGGRALADTIDPDEAGLAAALLLGDGTALDRAEWDRYIRTGVVHVLAISGQHLVVLAVFAWAVLRVVGVRRRYGAWAVALLLIGYAILTGGRPSAVRAAVMVAVLCGALVLRRPVRKANAFALAWLVVLGLNPTDPFTAGCQLSFLSVFVKEWTESDESGQHNRFCYNREPSDFQSDARRTGVPAKTPRIQAFPMSCRTEPAVADLPYFIAVWHSSVRVLYHLSASFVKLLTVPPAVAATFRKAETDQSRWEKVQKVRNTP